MKLVPEFGLLYDGGLMAEDRPLMDGAAISVISHRSRMMLLERLICHIHSRPGVWFATREEIAKFDRSGKE